LSGGGTVSKSSTWAFRETLAMDPHCSDPRSFFGPGLHGTGDSEAALEEVRKEPLQWPNDAASTAILYRFG
jgi:hypothetical protein